MALKYKVGDKVRIKDIDWYNKNKNDDGDVSCGEFNFVEGMKKFCSETLTISEDVGDGYLMLEDYRGYLWTDEMIERLVEEEGKETSWKPSKEEMDVLYSLAYITNKYDEHKEEVITRLYQDLKREFFNDSSYENMFPNTENDVRRRSTIQVLEYARSLDNYNQYGKADIDKNIAWLEKQGKSALEARTDNELVEEESSIDLTVKGEEIKERIEIAIPEGYEYVIESGKIIFTKKKKEYPKTYEECAMLLGLGVLNELKHYNLNILYKKDLIVSFQKLLICLDAYWKIAGDEMGLGKPWEPDWDAKDNHFYTIYTFNGKIECSATAHRNAVLIFPTAEMRDTFKVNFDKDIEFCKELL